MCRFGKRELIIRLTWGGVGVEIEMMRYLNVLCIMLLWSIIFICA
jgi:hypothetical protein